MIFKPLPKVNLPAFDALKPIGWTPDWDVFHGTWGDDWFSGGSGNDVMWGSIGADHFSGGADTDTVNYSNSGYGGVSVDLGRGMGWRGLADGDTYNSVENVIGTGFDDYIAGNADDNMILAGFGDDTVVITDGSDVLNGGAGIDTLAAYTDKITVNLATGTGSYGIAEGDTYIGFENVSLGGAENTIIGDSGVNLLRALGQFSTINAGAGDDVIEAVAWGGSVDGGAGIDTLFFLDPGLVPQAGLPSQYGLHVDLDAGEAYIDSPTASPVQTLANIENVFGSENADTFIDGAGDNFYAGIGGADLFDFDHDGSGERDEIKDFQIGVDRIDLSDTNVIDFDDLKDGGNRRLEQVGNDTVIHTGNNNEILLQGVIADTLTVDDFLF